jgi:hypothetical protein
MLESLIFLRRIFVQSEAAGIASDRRREAAWSNRGGEERRGE